MRQVIPSIRHAIRALAAQRASTTMAVAILALGLGACAAMYSVVTGVLLQPLAYPESERLIGLDLRTDVDTRSMARPEVAEMRSALRTIVSIGGADYADVFLAGSAEPRWTVAARVTYDVFTTLGVPPLIGRALNARDDDAGEHNIVISHRLWTAEFGSDTGAIGREVTIDGQPYRLAGVMPASFRLPWDLGLESPSDIWMPLVAREQDPRAARDLDVVGRLAPGVTLAAAQLELDRLAHDLAGRFPSSYPTDRRWTFASRPLLQGVTVQHRRALIVLFSAAACLLMLVVVNIAGLALSRLAMRAYEMDVRAAVGASLAQLRAQLIAESVLLAIAGGVVGLAAARVMLEALLPLVPQHVPRLAEIGIGWHTIGVTCAASVCIGVVIGIVTARRIRSNGVPVSGRALQRSLASLLAVEVAASVVLLAGAGLMVRTMARLNDESPGFDSSNTLTMRIALPRVAYPDAQSLERFFADAVTAVRTVPGVQVTGAVRRLPFATRIGRWTFRRSREEAGSVQTHFQVVTPGYFETLRIPLRAGRFITDDDRRAAPGIAVVSESMARQFWPGGDPLGAEIRMDGHPGNPWIRIVGIAADTRHDGFAEAPVPTIYLPFDQAATSAGPFMETAAMQLVVRSSASLEAIEPLIRARLRELDAGLPIGAARTLESVLASSNTERRFLARLLGAFSLMAVVLVALGIHGVLTLVVRERVPEIAVRIAIGARPVDVGRLVAQRVLLLTAMGAGVGIAVALAAGGTVSSFLYGVTPSDPVTFAVVLTIVATAVAAGGVAPLRRALSIETIAVLRQR